MTCGKKITRKYKAQLSKAEQKRFRSLMWEFRRDPKDLKPEERESPGSAVRRVACVEGRV